MVVRGFWVFVWNIESAQRSTMSQHRWYHHVDSGTGTLDGDTLLIPYSGIVDPHAVIADSENWGTFQVQATAEWATEYFGIVAMIRLRGYLLAISFRCYAATAISIYMNAHDSPDLVDPSEIDHGEIGRDSHDATLCRCGGATDRYGPYFLPTPLHKNLNRYFFCLDYIFTGR